MTIKQEKQEKLNILYEEHFPDSYFEDRAKNKNKNSYPLLIDLKNTNNINTGVMIFGQETNSWYDDDKIDKIVRLLDLYSNFLNKNLNSQTPFWQCFRKWLSKENSVFVWNNLSKMDCKTEGAKSRSILKCTNQDEIEKILKKSAEIIKKEIEIIKPKILIFLTGPNYDFIIEKYLCGRKEALLAESGLIERQLCEIKGFENKRL